MSVVKWIICFALFYIETCIWSSLLWWRGPAAGFFQPPLLYIAGPIGGVAGILLFFLIERYISEFPDDRKARWKAVMWTAVISSLLLAIIYTNFVKEQVRQEILAYLHERYGIEFEITEGEFDTLAYPKGQPEIKFKVFRQAMGSPKYADWYLTEKWAFQARPFIEKKLRQVYGEEAVVCLKSCYFNFGDKSRYLDFEQAFEKNSSSSVHENFKVSYWVFMDGASFKQEEEAEKAYEIFEAFSCREFYVTYINIKDKEDFLAKPKQYYDNWHFKNTRRQSQRNQYEKDIEGKNLLAWLRVHDSLFSPLAVNNADDLIKYFGP